MNAPASGGDPRVGFVTDERYYWHQSQVSFGSDVEPGVQLETPEARRRLLHLLGKKGLRVRMTDLSPLELTQGDLERVHTPSYLSDFRRLSAGWGGELGDFAGFGPGSFDIAALSAGGVAAAVRSVLSGEVERAYALVRPPGHHAERDRGRGYCLLANIPLALEKARAEWGLRRAAVVDWDVHHGNGTQSIFWDDPDVLSVSIHQDRLYPVDSGSLDERGGPEALGSTINIPLPAGSGAGAYRDAFERVVVPSLARFAPDLIVVASGYDAAYLDPSSQMALLAESFGDLTRLMIAAADRLCDGRLVIAQEGGYSPLYTPLCGASVVAALTGSDVTVHDPYAKHRSTPEQMLHPHQRDAVRDAREAAGLTDAGLSAPDSTDADSTDAERTHHEHHDHTTHSSTDTLRS